MEDDSLIQLIWDLKCASAPRCADCGASIYAFDTYLQIGDFRFCERCTARSHRLHSEDLEL